MNANRWQRTGFGVGGLVALAVLFLGVVMLSNLGLRGMRLDLTQNRLYTLSRRHAAGARRTQGAVNLYFYFSRDAAAKQCAADHALRDPRARVSRGDRGALRRQDSSCTSSIRSRSPTTKIARPKSACSRCRPATAARRSTSDWPAPIRPTAAPRSRAFSPTARNSWNTTWRSSSTNWRRRRSR